MVKYNYKILITIDDSRNDLDQTIFLSIINATLTNKTERHTQIILEISKTQLYQFSDNVNP